MVDGTYVNDAADYKQLNAFRIHCRPQYDQLFSQLMDVNYKYDAYDSDMESQFPH